jgi:glycerol-3-phosphate dehydrogenase (NAD(P)+)
MSQRNRPEVRLGEALARGEPLSSALAELGQRVEAVELAPRVAAFAERHRVAAPIVSAIAKSIIGGHSTEEALAALMTAPMTHHA